MTWKVNKKDTNQKRPQSVPSQSKPPKIIMNTKKEQNKTL